MSNPITVRFTSTNVYNLNQGDHKISYGAAWCHLCEYYIDLTDNGREEYVHPIAPDETGHAHVGKLNDAARRHLFTQHGIYRLDHRDEESRTYMVGSPEEARAFLAGAA